MKCGEPRQRAQRRGDVPTSSTCDADAGHTGRHRYTRTIEAARKNTGVGTGSPLPRAEHARRSALKAMQRGSRDLTRRARADLARRRRLARHADNSRRKAAWLRDYKAERGCACGERDPIVLDLDHDDPATKTRNSKGGTDWRRLAWNALEAEVARCTVRCANCHRRRTAAQFGYA